MESNNLVDHRQSFGDVKWFDPRKGYGFIIGPNGEDVFVHYSVIVGDGFLTLRDGSRVRYEAVRGKKGWSAVNVVPAPCAVKITAL